jgi:hypothetical protein
VLNSEDMKIWSKHLAAFLLSLLFLNILNAREKPEIPNLRYYFSEDKSSFAGIIMLNQIWTRYIQNNPDVNGTAQYPDYDLGIYRSQMIFYTSLVNKVIIYTHLGYNGLTYRSPENSGLTLYNAQAEFILANNKLHLGMGLHSWNGISRYSNASIFESLVIDHPGFVNPFEKTFSRSGSQLGIYIKGTLSNLHYRLAVVKPFEYGTEKISTPVTTERINENLAVKGYFNWQFFDRENNLFPFLPMNNLGRQKIFNIGAGIYYFPEAMLVKAEKDLSTVDPMLAAMLIAAGSEHLLPQFADYYPSKISDIFLAAADAFLDMPLKNSGALTSYLGYYYNFFGPSYIRSMSRMNVSKMGASLTPPQGHGNSEWETGTGHIIRSEVGYMLPGTGIKNRFQPYAGITWKNFEALDEASLQYDAGINWLMQGHHVKWTLQYSSRPVYAIINNKNLINEYKGQIIMQTQIYF